MKNIIVSNRLPIKMSIDSEKNINFSYTSGGLSSAIRSLDMDFTWVGWSGSFVEDKNEQNIIKGYFGKKNIVPLFFDKENFDNFGKKNIVPLFFDKENFDNYYNGFSNNIIWPLFHYLIDRVEYDKKYWESYKYINQKFAEGIIGLYNGLKNCVR
jgi:trehalose-6-phosphate synthase